jgi:uncharacterized protein (TIRG00374 family)
VTEERPAETGRPVVPGERALSDEDLLTSTAAFPPEQRPATTSDERRRTRRQTLIRTVLVVAYLYVVFGILLPRVVDYRAVLDAFRDTPAQWLVVVFAVGIATWIAEGLAINAVLPELGVTRAVVTWLSMTAVGSTVPGPIKMAFGFRLFRTWGISVDRAALGLTINGLAAQASKLILPALAVLILTVGGVLPGWGFLLAVLIATPVALGVLVGIWIMRSERFARQVGAFATRATDAVARRMRRPEPEDLTGRLMGFREAAKDMILSRLAPITFTQLLARTMGYVLLTISLRAVGVGPEVLPLDVILAVFAAVMTITLLPIAPGGAGLPELLYISFFTQYVGNPSWDDLIAAGVMLYRGMSWFLPIPVGYVALFLQRQREKREARAAMERAAG